jgi:hypothetical protein
MASIPARASTRIASGIKRFQPILESAKTRDVNESDTVVITTDMLESVFGYDKYTEITSEHTIKSTFCDLALKPDGQLTALIEVKAIGLELKDNFVKQAVDYAANQGCDWVVLTNGILWRIYKVSFSKPIDKELVSEFDFITLNPMDENHLEQVFMLSKESWQREGLGEYYAQKQALSRFTLAAVLISESALTLCRRELRRVSPGVRINEEQIRAVLETEVIKREVLEGEKAESARKLVARAANKSLRENKSSDDGEESVAKDPPTPDPSPPNSEAE